MFTRDLLRNCLSPSKYRDWYIGCSVRLCSPRCSVSEDSLPCNCNNVDAAASYKTSADVIPSLFSKTCACVGTAHDMFLESSATEAISLIGVSLLIMSLFVRISRPVTEDTDRTAAPPLLLCVGC